MASGNQIKFGVGYEVDKSSIQKVKQSLRQLQNIKIGDFKGTEQQLQNVKKTALKVEEALRKAFNPTLNTANIQTFNSILKQSGRTIDTVYADFAKLGSQGRQAFTQVASQVMTTNTQLRETKTLLTSMGQTMVNTVKWGIASSVMNNFTQSIRQSVEYVKNLDSALTDIRIVTGDSTEKMKEFAVQANQAAQALGRSTMDYSKAALTFYQQGLSDEDVQARTQSTLIAQNITGAGQEMADYLTAVWNGYKVANEEAELYVDKLAAVADSSASNMAQLATAMSKVASTANMLGVPVDKLNAQIATITATTRQAPETVGNALKTIYARINDIATGADDAQISLGNYSSKMLEVGFSVLDASGKLRDTGDVMDEIGSKWATLSREQQIYLARTMAGQRQYNNLLALFENWSKYSELVNISMDSQGAAMEKNQRYLDSYAAKLEQFGAAQERVKSAFIDENDLKGITQFGTSAVNLFASLVEGIGGGKNALLAFGSIATSIFGNVIGKQIGNMIVKSQQAKASFQAMAQAVQNTANMKLSAAYRDQNNVAFRNYVNNLQEIQRTWSVLTVEEKQEQQQNVKNIATWSEDKQALIEAKQAAQDFANAISKKSINLDEGITESLKRKIENLFPVIEQAKEKLGSLYYIEDAGLIAKNNPAIQQFKNQLEKIVKIIGKDSTLGQEGQGLAKQLQYIYDNGRKAGISLENVSDKVNNFLERTKKIGVDTLNINNINNEIKQFDSKIKVVQDRFNQLNEQAKTIFNVQSIIKFTAGLGQIASSITTIVNLTKTWNNENISLGEKLLQTFTSIGFLLPMLISGFNSIKTSLGLDVALEKTNLEIKRQQLILQQTITAQKRLSTLEQKKQTMGLSEEEIIEYDILQTKLAQNAADGANISLQKTKLIILKEQLASTLKQAGSALLNFFTGPAGLIALAGVAAVAIGTTLYKAWNKASQAAKKATQQMKAANSIYKESKDTLEDLKSSLESLKDAQNNLKDLTTGTEQWKSALEDVNNQVIELLEKFPELAQYVSTSSNGMLQISEQGQQYITNQARQASQANAMAYLSSRQRSDSANRQSQITQASRNWGMGAWDTSVLDKVITAVQEQGSNVLANTRELQQLTGANSKQIEAIDKHKSEIIALAEKLTANTIATDSLTQSIITGTFLDPEKIASSVNSDIFTAQAAKAINNAQLNYSKYGIDTNRTTASQMSLSQYEKAWKQASNAGINYLDFTKSLSENAEIIIDDEAKAKIVERYKEINASIADEISISGGQIIRTVKETGEKTQLNFDDIMKAVIAADATTEQGMRQIYQHAEQIAQQYINKFGNQAGVIYKIGQGTQAAGEVSEEDLLGFISNEDVLNALHEQTGKDIDVIIQDIAHLANQTRRGIKDYIDSLPKQIGEDLKDLSDIDDNNIADISEAAQKVIGQSLQKAWENGTYDQYLDVLKDINPQDMEGFTTFIDGLGEEINSIDVSTFRDKLEELGISSEEVSDQKIQQLIDKLRELNGINLQEGLGQLYEGTTSFLEKYAKDSNATLSKKQFESLSQIASGLDMDLSQFFDQTWKGTYKLKTSAEEFFDYINNQSLNNFEEAFSAAAEKVSQLTLAQNFKDTSGYSSKDLTYWSGASGTQGDAARIAAAEFLQGLGNNNEYLEDIIQGKEISEDHIKYLQEQLPLVADKWDNISEEVNNATSNLSTLASQQQQIIEAQEEMRQQMREMQLDDEVDADKWKDLSKYVHEYGTQINKTGKASERVSKDVEQNIEIAEDLAEAILRYSSALEEVADNYETWKEQLQSGSAEAAAQASRELADVYADLLDLPFEQGLTPNFTNDIQNLELLKQATEGSEQAYNQLLEKAGQNILLQVGIDKERFYSDKAAIEAEILNFTGQNFGDIEIGAALNDEAFLQSLTDIVNNAHMTAEQATNYLASMGIDAQVKEQDDVAEEEQQVAGYHAVPTEVPLRVRRIRPRADGKGYVTDILTETFSSVKYEPDYTTVKGKKENKSFALKVTSAHKSSGGNFKFSQTQHNTPAPKSSGGGGGSTKQPKQASTAKTSTDEISAKPKDQFVNPYEAIEKSYDRQEDKLKKLEDLQKKLVGKDRLNNLTKQNKELEKQNKIIQKRQKLSDDSATEGTTAYYQNQIQNTFGAGAFDKNGQLNQTSTKNAAVKAYNDVLNQQTAEYKAAQDAYNTWIEEIWNKYTGEEQEANKAEKELRDQNLKDAKTKAEETIKTAEEEYNEKIKLIENYKKALEEDKKFHEQYIENLRQIIENNIAKSKIKVDLSLDFGQLERDFQEFDNKVIKKLSKEDILGNAKASAEEIHSYFDSKQLTNLASRIKNITKQIQIMQAGGYSQLYGLSREAYEGLTEEEREALRTEYLAQAKEDLQDYTKKYMEEVGKIQDLRDSIYDNYLDSIDDVKDKMGEVIDQYERINDLTEHNIKLTQLLYGDNAGYDILDKYYDKQAQNNAAQMKSLQEQKKYWEEQLATVEVGTDPWKKFKANLDDTIDQINSLLETQLENIATKFENKVLKAIKNITTKLTQGLGNDYLEQEWDYISKDDDAFLDIVNSKFGVDEVERLYTDAAAALAGSPAQQKKMNKLMNDQLKLLRQKDKLTQYDIDRAKAALELEKARMALEEARANKSKMRLRRDSQGNYTYQYVADEQKLSDLQSALADAQSQLYNLDKEHYQQQLNQMYSTYKDYMQNMAELERQYAATTDETEKKRLERQMDLLRDKYSEYFDDISQDLQFTLTEYLTDSFGQAMNFNMEDFSPAEQIEILKENLPYTNSQMQVLSEEIQRQGGIVKATAQYYKELRDAASEAAAATQQALNEAGTSQSEVDSGENQDIDLTKQYIQDYKDAAEAAKEVTEEVKTLLQTIDEFLNKDLSENSFTTMLQEAYQTLQNINSLEGTTGAKILDIFSGGDVSEQLKSKNATSEKLQTAFNKRYSKYEEYEAKGMRIVNAINSKQLENLTQDQIDKYLKALTTYDTKMTSLSNSMGNIKNTAEEKNVSISVSFPNATDHNEILTAIENLQNRASQTKNKKNK